MAKVHVIAEAGTNHNGDFATAKRLVDTACASQADSVKFQIIYPDRLYLPGSYNYGHYDINEVRSMRQRFMLTDAEYEELSEYACGRGVPFSASIFDERGLALLAGMAPPYIKIASTDLGNVRLLRLAAATGLRVILSTGMSTLGEIERSVRAVVQEGPVDLVLMHCVSAYPAQLEHMNLAFIDVLRSAFGFPVALSDHTQGNTAACLAVTKSVEYIEKHFTLDRTQEGFDHKYAAEPADLSAYVSEIRAAERALAAPSEKLQQPEITVSERALRGLYAARDLAAGDVIGDEDVLIVRPPGPMGAQEYDELIGKSLERPLCRYAPFRRELLQ